MRAHGKASQVRLPAPTICAPEIVTVAAVDATGRVFVNVRGRGPTLAGLASGVSRHLSRVDVPESIVGARVVVAFEGGRSDQPIVIDIVEDRLKAAPDGSARSEGEETVPKEKLTLTAGESIELRCGESSIVLTRAGKVLIRGSYVSSSSSGVQRIRGGSIQLN